MNRGNRGLMIWGLIFVLAGGGFAVKSLTGGPEQPVLEDGQGRGMEERKVRELPLRAELPEELRGWDGDVPGAASDPVRLDVEFGAGRLTLGSGGFDGLEDVGKDLLVDGTAEFSMPALRPEVEYRGDRVELSVGDRKGFSLGDEVRNEWDLRLGRYPMELRLTLGGAQGEIDLGGAALTELRLKQGAGDYSVRFSRPNPVECGRIKVEGGASQLVMEKIANSGVRDFEYDGGAGRSVLDFTGELRRDIEAGVSSGLSQTVLIFPRSAEVEIESKVGLGSAEADPGFVRIDGGYRFVPEGAEPAGGRYRIDLSLDMGLGSVRFELAD